MKMALRDKSSLQAQVASLQKTNYDISRGKNILQAKVTPCLLVYGEEEEQGVGGGGGGRGAGKGRRGVGGGGLVIGGGLPRS